MIARLKAAFPHLSNVEWRAPRETGEFLFDSVGGRTRRKYLSPKWYDGVKSIAMDEDVFEWISVAESVQAAGDRYVIADLGAGYGRWLVNAALLARQFGRRPFVIGVEAEDTHFSWMKEHLADNNIPSADQRLFHAPITGERRLVPFTLGHASDWYGQSVLPTAEAGFGNWQNVRVEMRASIILDDIITDEQIIDFLDLDIQGLEAEVVRSAIKLISRRVKRIHIGTHSQEIEEALRDVFNAAGWERRFDYPCATRNHPTPVGLVDFVDGVQSWCNPRFA